MTPQCQKSLEKCGLVASKAGSPLRGERNRALQVFDTGWGEPHAYADSDTQIMLYAPRNEEEIDIIDGLLRESIEFVKSSLVNVGAAGR